MSTPDSHAGSALPDALDQMRQIEARLAGRHPAFFLDYDGTLTPIVDRPEQAVLSDAMRATVAELAGLATVAIVSGRDRADVTGMVGLDGLVYAGSHGFDIAGPNGLRKEHEDAAAYLPALDEADQRLRGMLADVPGCLVERKRFAIAVHYRLVPADRTGTVKAAVDEVARALPSLRQTGGKMIHELRPRLPWDKGKAVLWLLAALGLDRPDVLPFYLGDDETDEDAFRALRERGGIGLLVADPANPPDSAAAYLLRDTESVGRFLTGMVAYLKKSTR